MSSCPLRFPIYVHFVAPKMDQNYQGLLPFCRDFLIATGLDYFPMDFSNDQATLPIILLATAEEAIMEQHRKVHQGPMVAA